MTPYKVHDTWVDLDSVIAIGSFQCCSGRSHGEMEAAFHSGPIKIDLTIIADDGYSFAVGKSEAIWTAFIEAWKNRETKKP